MEIIENVPASAGGRPVRDTFLVFGRPAIGKEEFTELEDTLRSGWLGTGPKTQHFERDFAAYTHAPYALGLNSCTAGLHLALNVLDVSAGDEVVTTPMTFAATANVIIHVGARPVFVDVDRETFNVTAEALAAAISNKTKAIMPVDMCGRPCEMHEIMSLARTKRLPVVEDAAHAAESWIGNAKTGSIADITAFSFYVTKNIVTGEGGMVTTANPDWDCEMRMRSLHGLNKDAWKRYSSHGFAAYEVAYPGFKYNMTDLQASLGIHQLARVEDNLKIRERIWSRYDEAFSELPAIIVPAREFRGRHARHLYTILLRLERLNIGRADFIGALRAENIGAGVHFWPVHLHDYYRQTFGFKAGDFPNAEFIGERTVSLPLSAALTDSDVQTVIDAVSRIERYYRK